MENRARNPVSSRLIRQANVRHLCRLGPRAVLEAMVEVAQCSNIDAVLSRYADIDLDTLKAIGGTDFPSTPLHLVQSDE